MLKKSLLFLTGIFFLAKFCYAIDIIETDNFVFSMDAYLRNDLVSFKNVVDLDSANSDDTTTYLGIDYSLGARLKFKNSGPEFYLKLERNGPTDYDAPLFVHNTLMTSGGTIGHYRNDDLLPQLEEFWLDTLLGNKMRFKLGLYAYEVGNGFSLNGAYENYGFSLYREAQGVLYRIYYCRPDLSYKNHLGPRIRQEEEQGIDYQANAANFFAADVKLKLGENYLWPYIGVLSDYTAQGKRNNVFSTPTKRDILGTLGVAFDFKKERLSFKAEMAHNFGKAKSDNPDYKDVYHTGYLIYTDLDYQIGRFIPALHFLLCSGNKVKLEEASADTLTSSKNRAFSYYSPLNKYLDDSIGSIHAELRPVVFMGAGYGLNYGVPRPGTFASSDFDNIVLVSSGFDFQATQKLCLGIYGYYLRSFARPVGSFSTEAKYLPQELGYELDCTLDYKLKQNISLGILGGIFVPGKYYKQERDNTPDSLLSPYVRGDGKADNAYQIELAMEFNF